jgi:type IV pilus assembly protein PilY1
MKTVRNAALIALATLASLLLGATTNPAAAVECDVPLIVQQSSVPANVLIIMDDSGSMNEAMFHPDFRPGTVYAGKFKTNTMYYISTTGLKSPASFNASWANTPTARLVTGVNGMEGRYIGNYLNWIYYTATDAQRAALPQVTRFHVGRAAVQSVITQAVGLRYGLMAFNDDDGGRLHAGIGSTTPQVTAALNAMAPNSWTPSAETLETAMEYFQDDSASAPITFACQQNFIVFVTDGYPTKDLSVSIGDADGDGQDPGDCTTIGAIGYPASNDCSAWMDDVAYYMANHDMRPDLDGEQSITTYMIGFGIDAPLLQSTADNGGGMYLVAWELNSLVQALGTVIGDIVQRISSGAAVAVVSTEQGAGDRLYRGKFMPGQWRGYLESYSLPYAEGDTPAWEAGALLRDRNGGDRTIYTRLADNTTIPFVDEWAEDLNADMRAGSVDTAASIINYVRGDESAALRDRGGWKLGDLVYSTPLVVGPPSNFFLTESYQQFLMEHHDRQPTVYVGANDGMLHAFDGESGYERWCYVPRGVLGHLEDLAAPDYCHKSYVDLSPSAFDVQLNGAWRTVLVGGLRGGGDSYFAIDVTDGTAPTVLWETSVPALTQSFTEPTIVRKGDATYLWTGSGPDAGGNAYLSVLNIADGTLLATAHVSSGASTNLCAAATVLDIDWDGDTDYVYQGDLQGNLYRFDVRDENPAVWSGDVLFDGDQPIQTRPEIALGPNEAVMVYFGTGKYVQAADLATEDQQSFLCIKDDGTKVNLTLSDLADQTDVVHDVDSFQGWRFDLVQGAGERVTEPAAVVEGVVYFTSYAPRGGACSGGGQSWLYHVDFEDGSDVDNDGEENQETEDRVEALGDGVASKPVINLRDETVIVQTSDARLNMMDLRTPPQWMTVRAWRERFEQLNVEGGQVSTGQ